MCTWNRIKYGKVSCSCLATKLCLTLCDPMDCGPPVSSLHGIFQVRILEWVATSFWEKDPHPLASPALAGRFFTTRTVCSIDLSLALRRAALNDFALTMYPPVSHLKNKYACFHHSGAWKPQMEMFTSFVSSKALLFIYRQNIFSPVFITWHYGDPENCKYWRMKKQTQHCVKKLFVRFFDVILFKVWDDCMDEFLWNCRNGNEESTFLNYPWSCFLTEKSQGVTNLCWLWIEIWGNNDWGFQTSFL